MCRGLEYSVIFGFLRMLSSLQVKVKNCCDRETCFQSFPANAGLC